MKNNIILTCLCLGAIASSCSTVSNTSSSEPIKSIVDQYPTVANLDVDSQKVEKTVTWDWSIFGSQYSFTQRKKNLTADLLKEKNADVLVEPQYIFTKTMFGPRTLTIYGFPAKFKNFRNATVDDIHAIGMINGTPCNDEQKAPNKSLLSFLSHKTKDKAEKPSSHSNPLDGTSNYLRIGMSGMAYYLNSETTDRKIGYNITVGKRFALGSRSYYAIEFGLISRGADNIGDNSYYSLSEIKHAVQISPATFGYMLPVGQNVRFDFHVGAAVSYDYLYSYDAKHGESYHSDFLEDFYDSNSFDVAANIGYGIWYKNFNIDFSYRHGLRDAIPDGTSRDLIISLGLGF